MGAYTAAALCDRTEVEMLVFVAAMIPLAGETAGESPQSATPFSSPFTATAWRSVPTRAVIGSGDRLFPPEFMRTLVRTRLGIEPDVVNAGHLIAMARPNELASPILDYVAGAERSPDGDARIAIT